MAANSLMRTKTRVPLNCSVDYSSSTVAGKGIVQDISKEGLKVDGHHAMHCGMRLRLAIHVPNEATPIEIDCAFVRWTNGKEFGIKFQQLQPGTRAKLCQFFAMSAEDLPVLT